LHEEVQVELALVADEIESQGDLFPFDSGIDCAAKLAFHFDWEEIDKRSSEDIGVLYP